MRFSVLILGALLFAVVGCGETTSGPKTYAVTGDVTFDGKPVETGRILMRQTQGSGKAFSAEIVEGKYKIDVEEGPVKVEITASRPIPGKFDNSNGTPEPIGEMYIPAKYNSKSELTADISPDSENVFPFDLKAK